MEYSQRALELFHLGYNCSQSVFAAFADYIGLDENKALALSSGFGAGIGRMREVCGAFSALVMVCGILKNDGQIEPRDREHIYLIIRQLTKKFKDEFGSLYCRDLLGLTDEERLNESARPAERTPAYYQTRPCERCISYCAGLGEKLIKP